MESPRTMQREYHKWNAPDLDRQMELLVFGHAGLPVLVFPTSNGRFYEFEDAGMVAALSNRIDRGDLQLFCIDSFDPFSWYNTAIAPRLRILQHTRFERYILRDVLPFIRSSNSHPHLLALGCSFGGYHAANIAFRHPHLFTDMLSLSGAFDLTEFLSGYTDQSCYENLPMQYLPHVTDPARLDLYRHNRYTLATGWDDQCLPHNQALHHILDQQQIPHQFCVWDSHNSHDWPTWKQMVQLYL